MPTLAKKLIFQVQAGYSVDGRRDFISLLQDRLCLLASKFPN